MLEQRKDHKTEVLQIRLTSGQKKVILELAANCEMSTTDFILHCIQTVANQ
jgi:uncharacterized protein (DUF1778 family)